MKIQKNLVWDKHAGDLNGSVDFGDAELNYATLQKSTDIAIGTDIDNATDIDFPSSKFCNYRIYIISNVFTSFSVKPISICELNSVKVLAVTCGGLSLNCKLFHLHFLTTKENGMNSDTDVTYRTVNLLSSGKRFIYLISDVPHLMKAARNCVYNSGNGRYTYHM